MAKRKQFSLTDILAPIADVVARLQDRRDTLMAEVEMIDGELARFGHSGNGRKGKGGAKGKKAGRRTRRTREEIEAHARDIVAFIAHKGKEGATGREIKAKFGALLPSVKEYLKQYAPEGKIRTTGVKANMRYHG